MKNVTVSLDDDTYRRARVYAAEQDRTLSALVREFLNSIGSGETEFERLARKERELRAELLARGGIPSGEWLSRDEVHDRTARRDEHRRAGGR